MSRIGGHYFAFVAEPDQKGGYVVHQKPLEVGQIVGNNYVVLDGVKPGDKVVVSGTQFLIDGVPVIPQERAAANQRRITGYSKSAQINSQQRR